MRANCVKLWSRTPLLELLAALGCRLLGLSCSGVATGDSTRLPPSVTALPCAAEADAPPGATTLRRPRVATPDWLLRRGAGRAFASDVDLAEATAASLSSRSGGCSRWEVARRLRTTTITQFQMVRAHRYNPSNA